MGFFRWVFLVGFLGGFFLVGFLLATLPGGGAGGGQGAAQGHGPAAPRLCAAEGIVQPGGRRQRR